MAQKKPLVLSSGGIKQIISSGDSLDVTTLGTGTPSANTLLLGDGTWDSFGVNTFPARGSTGNLVPKTITDFALGLLDDSDAATMRTTLGLGTISTQNSSSVSITGGSITSLGTLSLANDGTGAFNISVAHNGTLTAARTLTLNLNNGDRTLSLGGNLSTSSSFTTVGAFSVSLTATAATNITLPTSGTLATLSNVETLSNKVLASPTFSGTVIGDISGTTNRLRGLSVIQAGYVEANPVNFRFDQDILRYINRKGVTSTLTGFTTADLDNLFSQFASVVNLIGKGDPCILELTGLSFNNTANAEWYPYVLMHSPYPSLNVKMEILTSGSASWQEQYDGPAGGAAGYHIAKVSAASAGTLTGARWTFTGHGTTNNCYLRSVGVIGRNSEAYQWNVMKGGDVMQGDLTFNPNYKLIAQSSTSSAAMRVVAGSDPTSPVSGDVWNLGGALKFYNGSTKTIAFLDSTITGNAANVTGIVAGANGGTGVNNSGKTITLGGNLTTSGAYAVTLTATGATNVTLPTSGTLATTGANTFTGSQTITGSLTVSSTISASNLGTPVAGGIIYGANGTNYASTAAGTTGQILTSNGASPPSWQDPAITGVTFTSSSTPPSSPSPGDEWLNTTDGVVYTYYNDGDSSQWVDLSGSSMFNTTAASPIYISDQQPADLTPYLWVQTGLGDDQTGITLWINI